MNVEASALRAPAGLSRLSISLPLLRLRSDDQLLALFRAGSDEAFNVLHDRYRQRLFAYVRQMLSARIAPGRRGRAAGRLRARLRRAAGRRAPGQRARLALPRRPQPLHRPPAPPRARRRPTSSRCRARRCTTRSRTPQRREDLRRLVTDVGRLPDQQRSALLMREIDGMSYADLAAALDVTVPAVKSLLVRARLGLVEAAEARSTDCAVIREDLASAYDRGVKASGARPPAHARVLGLPRVPQGAAQRALLLRRAVARRRRRRGADGEAVASAAAAAAGGAAASGGGALAGGARRRGRRDRLQGRGRRLRRRAHRGRRRRGQADRRRTSRAARAAARRSPPRPPRRARPDHAATPRSRAPPRPPRRRSPRPSPVRRAAPRRASATRGGEGRARPRSRRRSRATSRPTSAAPRRRTSRCRRTGGVTAPDEPVGLRAAASTRRR